MRHFILLIMLFVIFACNQSGKDYYEAGEKQFKKADHEDYYDWNYLKKARDDFEKAIKKGFVERNLYDDLSICYHFLGDKKNEERAYTLGLLHFPNDIKFHFDRGNLYKETKKYKTAFLDYDKVVLSETASIYYKDALYYRGAMSYLLGDTQAANVDRLKAKKISNKDLREYSDYCKLWQ